MSKAKNLTDKEVYASLPHNRKEVFFDLLKHRKMHLFALSCFVFMFFIPLAVDLIYFNFLESAAIAAEKSEYLFSLIFYSMLIMIPCMMIGFIGFAGGFYTVKKIVWQESTMLSVDFFVGIKENWKNALINGFIFGVITFGLVVGGSYLYIFAPMAPVGVGIGIGGLILVFLFFGMLMPVFFTQDVYYQNPYIITFKNSFAFLGLLNWKVLVIYLLTTCALVALCAINLITLVIGLFLFAVLNSLIIVLYTLIAHAAFDKFINKDHHPEMVNKGLYKEIHQNDEEKEF